ncbi:MAG: YdbH domain-containing protein [Desulfosalsimonas sp.]|uniref:intermembrane phospholipid transport protein YdbH family protein n=1 Tax=Desulfosalsimonas sp. TaxID=3073848 RepID=UPI003971106C
MQTQLRRLIGKTVRIIVPVLLFLLLAAVGVLTLGPAALEKYITYRMQDAGLENPKISVVSLGLGGLDLRDVSADNPDFQIDFVHFSYTVKSLMQGRVTEVLISGLRYHVDMDRRVPAAAAPSSSPDTHRFSDVMSKDQISALVFFDQIHIRNSVLKICSSDTCHTVLFDAALAAQSPNNLHFSVNPMIYGIPVHIRGRMDLRALETSGEIRVFADQDPASQHVPVDWQKQDKTADPDFEPGIAGNWSVHLGEKQQGRFQISAAARSLDLSGLGMEAGLDRAFFSVRAVFDDKWTLHDTQAELCLNGLFYKDFQIDSLECVLTEKGGKLALAADMGRPFAASLRINGTRSRFSEILETGKWQADLNWHLTGQITSAELTAMLPVDVRVSPAAGLDAAGRLAAGFSSARINKKKSGQNSWFVDLQTEKFAFTSLNIHVPKSLLTVRGLDLPGPVFVKGGPNGWKTRIYAKVNQVRMASPEIDIRDTTLDLPVIVNDEIAEPGSFAISLIQYDDIALPAVTGTALVRVQTRDRLLRPVLQPQLTFSVENGDIDWPGAGLKASGINGRVEIRDLFPLTTPGNQRIDIKRLQAGELGLEDGFVIFRIEPESLFLEKTRWHLPDGGVLTAHSSRLDFDPLAADFDVFFQDVDLIGLVARLTKEKIVGSGRVHGRVPVQWRPERIRIGRGFLYSVPGTGRFGIKDEKWLNALMLYVRDALAGHEYLSLLSKRLEKALGDFEYHFLSINLEPGNQDAAARIELRGKGVEGESPQEVGSLVINVNAIEEILNRVLGFYRTKDRSIAEALDALFEDSREIPQGSGE